MIILFINVSNASKFVPKSESFCAAQNWMHVGGRDNTRREINLANFEKIVCFDLKPGQLCSAKANNQQDESETRLLFWFYHKLIYCCSFD